MSESQTSPDSVQISKAEYERYLQLDHADKRTQIQESILATKDLVDDIDQPIRKSLAMLSLLGCKTIWSCCGFDYEGQPVHKFHEYGTVFFRMHFSEASHTVAANLLMARLALPWEIKLFYTNIPEVQFKAPIGFEDHLKTWENSLCPHYPEPAVQAICNLENRLIKFKEHFLDEVTLVDTNAEYQKAFPDWQYPPKNPWVIRKADYV